MKFCNDCQTNKSIEEFYSNKSKRDGLQSICKICSINRARAHQQANPEKKRINNKTYGERHAVELREKRHKYYQRTKTDRQTTIKRWYAANRNANLAYQARWRNSNLEYIRTQNRQYQRSHPEVYRASRYNRRARKKSAAGHATRTQIQARIDFYGKQCWICKAQFADMDHVIPLSRGGTN